MAFSYDVIVVGVGAMGSAATYHLARRGQRVLALEQYDIPHAFGSSHGETRIIRLAYYEDPAYVALLRRAYELWYDLERWAGEELFIPTGSIDAGPERGWVFRGSLESCLTHELPHEVLDAGEVARRWPGYRLDGDMRAVYQPGGGFLRPERAIVAHVQRAHEHGADVRARQAVTAVRWDDQGATVETVSGTYSAGHLVITAGAWMADLVPDLRGVAVPERQVLGWFQPRQARLFQPDRFPVFNLEADDGNRWYGLPIYGVPGFKIGKYRHLGEQGPADTMRWEPDMADEAVLREGVTRWFPEADGPVMGLRVCMFTNTPNGHFVVDRLPGAPHVVVASPCSGHGFKFAAVVGELLADLVIDGTSTHHASLFRLTEDRTA